jgi:hypothetical protein
MNVPRYEKLTVGILFKREEGVFGPRGLGLFYDPTQKREPVQHKTVYEEYTEETIYGKLSQIGGKHKYPNVDPQKGADLYYRTLCMAGIKAEEPVEIPLRLELEGKRGYIVKFPLVNLERGRSIFEFLSTLYYNHRNVLTSFIYLDRAKINDQEKATIITLGPNVKIFQAERFKPVYIGGTQQTDRVTLDKSVIALEFYSVDKQKLKQVMGRIESKYYNFSMSFEDLPADQVAYTHSVIWDNKDLPRGYRANFKRRGLVAFEDRDIGELVAYSLFPAEMESRLIESLELFQKMIVDPGGILQSCREVNKLIKQVVKDEFYAEFA